LNQEYEGAVPPFIPVAVNETPVPEQTEVAELDIATLGKAVEFTVSAIKLDSAVLVERQEANVPPAISLTDIISPFWGV
jgi:hypothetical protein